MILFGPGEIFSSSGRLRNSQFPGPELSFSRHISFFVLHGQNFFRENNDSPPIGYQMSYP